MRRPPFPPRARAAAAGVLASWLAACGGGGHGGPGPSPPPSPSPSSDRVIVAAGDIACGSATSPIAPCRHPQTAELIAQIGPDAVLSLGDAQYEFGAFGDYMRFFEPTWGRFKPMTRPVPGNHDYETPQARGYYDYFNGANSFSGPAGDRDKGYYSFDLGDWHFVALNSNCVAVRGCSNGSPQASFLRLDLALNQKPCTLAYWHHPRFSSGLNGNTPEMADIWQALYEFRVDVVLNGHDHDYERFALQTPAAVPDPESGIRELVVGTGGHDVRRFAPRIEPNSEVRDSATFGVLRMRLRRTSYEWEFVPMAGQTFTDRGSEACRGEAL